jgi:hypothetical protein
MRHLDDLQIAEAERDLLACHRLARLVGTTSFVAGELMGGAIEIVARDGDARLIEDGRLSAKDALAYLRELRNLPALTSMAELLETQERFGFLDLVHCSARDEKVLRDLLETAKCPSLSTAMLGYRADKVDWDAILRMSNEQLDKAVAAARSPTSRERSKSFDALARERSAMQAELAHPGKRASLTRLIGDRLVLLFLPDFDSFRTAQDYQRTRATLNELAFALTAYRAEHGACPERLDMLAPQYIREVPRDVFTEQPLRYEPQPGGFVLYSVGVNGIDENGREQYSTPPGDDVALRITYR